MIERETMAASGGDDAAGGMTRLVKSASIVTAVAGALFFACALGYKVAAGEIESGEGGLSEEAVDFLMFAYGFGAMALFSVALLAHSYPRVVGWLLVGAGVPLVPLAGMEFAASDLSGLEVAIGVVSAVAFVLPPGAGAMFLVAARRARTA